MLPTVVAPRRQERVISLSQTTSWALTSRGCPTTQHPRLARASRPPWPPVPPAALGASPAAAAGRDFRAGTAELGLRGPHQRARARKRSATRRNHCTRGRARPPRERRPLLQLRKARRALVLLLLRLLLLRRALLVLELQLRGEPLLLLQALRLLLRMIRVARLLHGAL
eukprot:3730665-Prymnesium_polylepis.1